MKNEEFENSLKKAVKGIKQVESMAKLTEDRQKMVHLINEHLLPCGDDLILLTLKGHIIIENLMEINLCRLLEIQQLPAKIGRLNFTQKNCLLKEAVIQSEEPGPNADLFMVIGALNDLRNQIAHKLKQPDQIQQETRAFINSCGSKLLIKARPDKPPSTQLRVCIIEICVFLNKVMLHMFKLKQKAIE